MDAAVTPMQVGIHGYDITTSCNLFAPERLFEVVGELNALGVAGSGSVGIEVYPTRHTPIAPVDGRHLLQWQRRYGAPVRRVHLEFASDAPEVRHILRRADQSKGVISRAMLRALYALLPDVAAGRGIDLAAELNVGVNVHSNVLARLLQTDELAELTCRVPFVLAENNIHADYLYVNGPITYDPRVVVDQLVGRCGVTGLLLALDHLFEHNGTPAIDPLAILEDPRIQRWTEAIHIAGKGHALVRPGDPSMERLLRKLARTPFAHPVRLAFDYSPLAMLRYSTRAQVRLFGDTIKWLRALHSTA